MSAERDPRYYLDWAKDELASIFKDMEIDGDTDGTYELSNLASGFNVLLRYAEKGAAAEKAQEEKDGEAKWAPLTAGEAIAALLAGKRIRRRAWDAGRFVYLDGDGDVRTQDGDYASFAPIQAPKGIVCSLSEAEAYHSELALPLWEACEGEGDEGKGEKE